MNEITALLFRALSMLYQKALLIFLPNCIHGGGEEEDNFIMVIFRNQQIEDTYLQLGNVI